jgi:integrase
LWQGTVRFDPYNICVSICMRGSAMGDQRIKIQKRETKDGRVRYLAQYAIPDGGFRSAGTFGRRVDAVAAASRAADAIEANDWADPKAGSKLLDDYVREVWLKELPGTVEVSTLDSYESYYRTHIKPYFGDVPIGRILNGHVKRWISEMETGTGRYSTSVGRGTQHKAHRILALILSSAKRNKVLRGDLATEGAKPRRVEQKDVRALTPAQYERLFAEVPDHWKPLVQTAVDSGMRLSELRALSPSQIDWDRNRIRVAPGMIRTKKGSSDSRYVEKAYPKGGRKRVVELGVHEIVEDTLGVLDDLIASRGMAEDSQDPIFTDEKGRLISNEGTWQMIHDAAIRAGLEGWSFKHLRSTCASWDLERTQDIMFVKNKMGHASVTTTEKHYIGNLLPDESDASNLTSLERFRQRRAAFDNSVRRPARNVVAAHSRP